MGLSEIAEGVEVTTEQRDRGVATVDDTDADLATRLADYADSLPCDADSAATVVEVYAEGQCIGSAARIADLPPVTAAKTLHLLGEQVTPLGPTGRDIVRDWLAADLSRTEALALTGVSEDEFALAAFVETHDPITGARQAVAGTLEPDEPGCDPLDEARSDVADLRKF
jgi:hypothetical protein